MSSRAEDTPAGWYEHLQATLENLGSVFDKPICSSTYLGQ